MSQKHNSSNADKLDIDSKP